MIAVGVQFPKKKIKSWVKIGEIKADVVGADTRKCRKDFFVIFSFETLQVKIKSRSHADVDRVPVRCII